VQALASKSALAMPRRAANGIESNRLLLVSAVLSRRLGTAAPRPRPLRQRDRRPADRGAGRRPGVALSIVSSFRDKTIDPRTVVCGEVGSVRASCGRVSQLEIRLREAAKLGFERAVVPRAPAARAVKDIGLDVIRSPRSAKRPRRRCCRSGLHRRLFAEEVHIQMQHAFSGGVRAEWRLVDRLRRGVARCQYAREQREEARVNLQEAVRLVLEANRELARREAEGRDVVREVLLLAVP
jgi:predicted ATP-dependent serine protease